MPRTECPRNRMPPLMLPEKCPMHVSFACLYHRGHFSTEHSFSLFFGEGRPMSTTTDSRTAVVHHTNETHTHRQRLIRHRRTTVLYTTAYFATLHQKLLTETSTSHLQIIIRLYSTTDGSRQKRGYRSSNRCTPICAQTVKSLKQNTKCF